MVAALCACTVGVFGLGAASASAETVWLCKPGLANNPCTSSEETTVELGNGSSFIEHAEPASNPPIDCFYVYPTVSSQGSVNANLEIGHEETQIAIDQASRFSQTCKVYAPIYPQLTLAAISTPGEVTAEAAEKAYRGVLSAWQEYLAKYNDGRGVVLIGHSQGALLLKQLVKEQIDTNPAVRKQLVSAILLGGNVLVPKGKTVGGDFQTVPSCQTAEQTRCVVAYSSFLEEPPEGAFFGRVSSPLLSGEGHTAEEDEELEVLCVNPALPVQANVSGSLLRYESTTPFPGLLGSDFQAPKGPTPWVSMPEQYSGQCERANGATWLQLTDIGPEGDPRERIKEALGPLWGTHLEDVNAALGNLVGLTAIQSRVYLENLQTPYVGSITPSSGPASGETPVRIKGSGFLPGTKVTIGSAPTSVDVVSETEITATTTASAPGTDEVVVSDENGTSSGGPLYTYYIFPPPTVVTGSTSAVSSGAATLSATVNPNGVEVSKCKFEYGTTTSYELSAPCTSAPGSGSSPVAVSAVVKGLTQNTTYHFRISATGLGGTSRGSDETFKTLVTPHWYSEGAIMPEGEATQDIEWGNLTLKGEAEISCHSAIGGWVENPTGGGPGVDATAAFATWGCVANYPCPAGARPGIGPENLPWESGLEENAAGRPREPNPGERLIVGCQTPAEDRVTGTAFIAGKQVYQPLAPAGPIKGTSAMHPGYLEFDSGSGDLEAEGSLGTTLTTTEGHLKVLGFEHQEHIYVQSP